MSFKTGKCFSVGMAALFLVMNLTGCGSGETANVQDSPVEETLAENGIGGKPAGESTEGTQAAAGKGKAATAEAAGAEPVDTGDMFTDRDLSGEYDESEAEVISLSNGDVTISEEGVYILRGSLKDGMVIVDADENAKVQLVLDGVEIDNGSNAAVYVRQADKVFLTLAEGSKNTLTSGGYTSIDDNNIDGVIFSKCDLTINGTGALTVNGEAGHGIVSKDDMVVAGGELSVTAESHGLSGKDSVRIAAGSVNITSGKDGIHSENEEDSEKGFVYISDGDITILSQGDGVSAGGVFQADGGSVNITAGGGSGNKTVATDENGDTISTKGIKAAGKAAINNGSITIDSQDDALHSNADFAVNGGELYLKTGDDGIHADATAAIAGGTIHISESYEGIEGNDVVVSGGYITLCAEDDGLNAVGGNDRSGFGGMFGQGEGFGGGESASTSSITISGGVLYINADGDGLDSNGSLTVTGGEVYVSGPENGANGALDSEGAAQITGGVVVAVGNSAMAMNFGDTSTQGSIMVTVSDQEAGTTVILKDSERKELVSYTVESAFNSIVVSCPELVLGGTYTIAAGDESTEVTLSDSLIYGSGFGMGGHGGMGGSGGMGGHGNMGGSRPEGNQGQRTPGELPEGTENMEGMPPMPGGEMPGMK